MTLNAWPFSVFFGVEMMKMEARDGIEPPFSALQALPLPYWVPRLSPASHKEASVENLVMIMEEAEYKK